MTLLPAITDLDDNSSVFGLDCPPLKQDHCDLLLDAIDAELGQLQVCDYILSVCQCVVMPVSSRPSQHFKGEYCTLYSTKFSYSADLNY